MIKLRIKFICFTALVLVMAAMPCAAESLKESLRDAQKGGVYQTPSSGELKTAQDLFEILFKAGPPDQMKTRWREIGFDFKICKTGRKRFYVVSEEETQKKGRGFFIFPTKPGGPRVLQIPHGFKDLDTDIIGLRLAEEGNFSGAAFNTVPRYYKKGGKKFVTDLGDLTDTYFVSFARALAKTRPDAHVIQIHGFSKSNRKSQAGSNADIILSNGTNYPPSWLLNLDDCLQRMMNIPVKAYPTESSELGGTENAVGRILRQMGYNRFVHMELSRKMRTELKNRSEDRKRFMECIRETLN